MVGRAVEVTVDSRAASRVLIQSGRNINQKRQPRAAGCSGVLGDSFGPTVLASSGFTPLS